MKTAKILPLKQIFIGNVLEAYHKVYQGMSDRKRDYWVNYDFLEANRSLLYNGDNKLVITSLPIDKNHLFQICQLCQWRHVQNLFPESPSFSICKDLLNKPKFSQIFRQVLKNNPGIALIPYRTTPEFYQLVTQLKQEKINFTLPETIPPESSFITAYYNTKRGFRHLWAKTLGALNLPITIPEGFIVGGREEAVEAAWWFRQQNRPFVIKHNLGVQGTGMSIYTLKGLDDDKKQFTQFLIATLKDKMWGEPPLIVEEFIPHDENLLGGSPSVEFFVDQNKRVTGTYPVEQLLENDRKTFKGCYIYPQLNTHPFIQTAFKAGLIYGKELARLGYRGYFDMDLVVGKNGRLYAVETNLRRTGGTHVHETALNLLGKNYLKTHHVLSEDIHFSAQKPVTYDEIYGQLKPFLYDRQTQTGVILGNPDMLKVNIFHAIYLAPTAQKLQVLRKRVEAVFKKV